MVSLTDSTSFDDPVYLRTHFLGRVASEDLGIAHQKQPWSKARTSRQHNQNLERWGAHWFQPLMAESLSSDSSDSSDDEEEDQPAVPTPSPRARASTLPVSRVSAVAQASLIDSKPLLKRDRSHSAPDSQLLPPRPLTINTLQPLRLSSTDLNALSTPPKPLAPVASSSRSSPVRIQYSESDGSCHGDAGDQDPEAQLAAGIIRLREARRAANKSSRSASKRRTAKFAPILPDSDDGDLINIQAHGGNFVLRLAEAMLDFGSAALERLSLPEVSPEPMTPQPQRRLSTTPKELAAETQSLGHRRRRRQQARSANVSRNPSSTNLSTFANMARTLSMPRLSTVLSPSTSLKQLTMSTASSSPPATEEPEEHERGFGQHSRTYSGYGLNTYADVPSAFAELNSLDAYGDRYHSTITALLDPTAHTSDSGADVVSPLWKVLTE